MENLLKKIYELYEEKVMEAQDMFLSEWCCSQEEEDKAKAEDQESLGYMTALLNEVRDKYNKRY